MFSFLKKDFFLFILLASLFSSSALLSENHSTENDTYTCKLKSQDCLNELNNVLLNKEDNRSIYKYCEITSDNFKLCCEDPLNCGEPWGKNMAQNLKKNSLDEVQNSGGDLLTCKLNNLSGLLSSLSSVQSEACEAGVKNCKISCESKLEEVTNAFKKCFFIPENMAIENVLKAVETLKEPDECLKKMLKIAKKYKKQSLYKKSDLRDKLQSKDIINCKKIRRANTHKNLNNFTLNVCYQAQEQNQVQEQKQATLNPEEMKKQEILKRQEIASLEYEKELEEQRKRKELIRQDTASIFGMRVEDLEKEPKSKQTNKQDLRDKGWNNDLQSLGFGLVDDPDSKKNTTNKTNSNIGALTGASLVAGAIGSNNGKNIPKRNQAINQKTSLNKANHSSLTGSNLKLAQAKANSGACPVNMPEIKSAVVFQSVEAPQIEPLDQQASSPYDNYDLVRNKHSTMFVNIGGLKTEFGYLQAFVDHDLFFNKKIQAGQANFPIDLPMKAGEFLDGVGGARIWLRFTSTNNSECYSQISFKVTVWETKKLDLTFAKINNNSCKPLNDKIYPLSTKGGIRTYQDAYNTKNLPNLPYESVNQSDVNSFIFSDELRRYLPEMLPLSENHLGRYRNTIDLEGHCDNSTLEALDVSKPFYASIGVLEDINNLEKKRIKDKNAENKIVAIVPMHYIPFHLANSYDLKNVKKASGIYGFVLHRGRYKTSKSFLWWKLSKSGGSSDVLFVRKDRHIGSTLSHEIGHTLGQDKEYYKKKSMGGDDCKDFNNSTLKDCFSYRIGRSFRFGNFYPNLLSIMHSGYFPITDKWIDRDTYQKAFSNLLTDENKKDARVIPSSKLEDRKVSKAKKDSSITDNPIVIVSGIYLTNTDLKKEKFLNKPKMEIHKEGGKLTPFNKNGDIQIDLMSNLDIIYSTRLSSLAEIELLSKEGGETYYLSSVPITVALPLKNRVNVDYKIRIRQVIKGDPGRVLFSGEIPKLK